MSNQMFAAEPPAPAPPPEAARFATTDLAESVSYIRSTSIGHFLHPVRRSETVEFFHWMIGLAHTDIDLVSVECGTEFLVDRVSNPNQYYVHLPIRGTCQILGPEELTATAGRVFALNPTNLVRKRWVGGCRQILVRLDRQDVERVLTDELGIECYAPLVFDPIVLDAERSNGLAHLLYSVWGMFASGAPVQQPGVARALERGLISGLLATLPHNYSTQLRHSCESVAPYYIRRAIDYIHAHLSEPILPQALAEAAGVSARSVYYGFRRWRGTTPMGYIRNARLTLARQELKNARTSGLSVTEVALNVGYEHLSRFSKDYRQKFGELPSATVRGR
ncbi:MAG TPA: AraC family transcriptional regulator [Phenylobacterium sp.]|uniref:AraC family transcriptional regulator n=1 Tax=Phenylobacterium sp. TaxID=1871053 RepID=UPI002B45EB86|nr:AraC family transcriptional regulator [Phenylobacterium sp.]HKR88250.1 AraC family transcriptional regulator [Phenylobacterium sp.]